MLSTHAPVAAAHNERPPFPAPPTDRRLILVTGARQWTDSDEVARCLLAEGRAARQAGHRPVLIHGDTAITVSRDGALAGAEAFADQVARALGWQVIRFPFDPGEDCVFAPNRTIIDYPRWAAFDRGYFCGRGHRSSRPGMAGTYCPQSVYRRNEHMVACRPDVCLAFPLSSEVSDVVQDCVHRAQLAGIPVITASAPVPALV